MNQVEAEIEKLRKRVIEFRLFPEEGSIIEDWIPRDAAGLDKMFRILHARDISGKDYDGKIAVDGNIVGHVTSWQPSGDIMESNHDGVAFVHDYTIANLVKGAAFDGELRMLFHKQAVDPTTAKVDKENIVHIAPITNVKVDQTPQSEPIYSIEYHVGAEFECTTAFSGSYTAVSLIDKNENLLASMNIPEMYSVDTSMTTIKMRIMV